MAASASCGSACLKWCLLFSMNCGEHRSPAHDAVIVCKVVALLAVGFVHIKPFGGMKCDSVGTDLIGELVSVQQLKMAAVNCQDGTHCQVLFAVVARLGAVAVWFSWPCHLRHSI